MELNKIFSFRESEDEPRPFMDHLADLRLVIIRMAVVLVVAMVGAFFFRDLLASVIQRPLVAVDPERASSLQSLGVADSMTISLQLSYYAGLVISFPLITFFLAIPSLSFQIFRTFFPLFFKRLFINSFNLSSFFSLFYWERTTRRFWHYKIAIKA